MKADDVQSLMQIRQSRAGQKAFDIHKLFWGVDPQALIQVRTPGRRRNRVVASLGRSPAVHLSNRAYERARGIRRRRIKHRGRLLVTASRRGRRLMILNVRKGIPAKPRLKFVGWAPVTEYIPSPDIERAGTFKKGKRWVHDHDHNRGKWPKVWKDQHGNYYYGKATYFIGDRGWLER